MSTDWQKDWWEKDHIPFHREDTHPYLMEYLDLLKLEKGANILVPLCGKTVDMIFLRDKGFNVFGADISPTALEQFSNEQNISLSLIHI